MPDPTPLQAALHEKLNRAFGEPHRIDGGDRHWALRSLGYIAAINVLVNGGGREHPVVWVFDPHDPTDGVFHQHISDESEIDAIIKMIELKVRTAARPERR